MKKILYFSFLCFTFLILFKSIHISAQVTTTNQVTTTTANQVTTNNKWALDKGTIESQFNFLITTSGKYEDYKVVKEGWLWVLKAHVIDTIKLLHKDLRTIQKNSENKTKIIDSLKTEVVKLTDKYNIMYKEKNSLRFLGIVMSKLGYNSLMWTIITGLAALLLIFIFLFKRSNIVTVQTNKDLEELKKEFEAHRKRALEREEKLARQYMNELKKYKN
jgi:hypothetical protein